MRLGRVYAKGVVARAGLCIYTQHFGHVPRQSS
jgi:hypothetical protein